MNFQEEQQPDGLEMHDDASIASALTSVSYSLFALWQDLPLKELKPFFVGVPPTHGQDLAAPQAPRNLFDDQQPTGVYETAGGFPEEVTAGAADMTTNYTGVSSSTMVAPNQTVEEEESDDDGISAIGELDYLDGFTTSDNASSGVGLLGELSFLDD
jgi:hypothetical protein